MDCPHTSLLITMHVVCVVKVHEIEHWCGQLGYWYL